MVELNNELFESLDSKMDFLNEQSKTNTDGIYRIDLTKVKDKKKGYRSVIRFLPNLTKDGKVGQSAIEKISHYVDIKNPKELSGYFDSPKNFGEKCALSDLYFQLENAKNVILKNRAKLLKYSKRYYSYVVILEDDQQPELVGKIMIFQYGKTIKDKILAEKNGEISGIPCNVFDLSAGKDFVLVVKEIQTGDETYPDYKMSTFKSDMTSVPVFSKEKNMFKNVTLTSDGKVDPKTHDYIKKFLLDREYNLEDFGPKKLDETQQGKINEIIAFLTGKSNPNSISMKSELSPTTDDFGLEEFTTTSKSNKVSNLNDDNIDDDDNFFDDL